MRLDSVIPSILMNIRFLNTFHHTSTEVCFSTTNRDCIRFDGRKTRRLLGELCEVDGCDCLSDILVTIGGKPAAIRWIDRDAEDHQPGMEIAFPGEP